MSIRDQAAREVQLLEEELEGTDDPEERRRIEDAIRAIAMEVDQYENWYSQGEDNEWF